MIAFLKGEVILLEDDAVIVDVQGIGYRVFLLDAPVERGAQMELYIYDLIREDRHELYGTASRDTLEMFERLIDISGVGGKLAQKILRSNSSQTLRANIQKGDIDFLVSIKGVGKKTAQKIILELKGVLVESEDESVGDMGTLEALMSLGYSRRDCLPVLQDLQGETPEARLKEALKLLSRA